MSARLTGSGVRAVATALLAAAAMAAAASPLRAQEPAADTAEPPATATPEPAASDAQEPAATAAQEPAATDAREPAASDAQELAAGADQQATAGDAQDATSPPYTVECGPDADEDGRTVCYVDRGTYVGWRTFHSICHTCHAQDAVGSTFAPDLLVRMREIDKPTFMRSLDQGFEGQVGVMPAWGQDPNVNKYYEELWSYLRARADGVLLPGRPKRMRDAP